MQITLNLDAGPGSLWGPGALARMIDKEIPFRFGDETVQARVVAVGEMSADRRTANLVIEVPDGTVSAAIGTKNGKNFSIDFD